MIGGTWAISSAAAADLDALATLAVGCQSVPDRRVPALSDTAAAIGSEIVEFGGATWWDRTLVARGDDRRIVGWLLAEHDEEIGRVWWLGPFVEPAVEGQAALELAGRLYESAAPLREGVDEEEIAYDDRSDLFAALAAEHGFTIDPASLDLHLDRADFRPAPPGVMIRVPGEDDLPAIAEIHDELFPGTHTLGSQLVGFTDDKRVLLCCEFDGEVAGYVATEAQHDGSIYVDYLGVRPRFQGHGLGRSLVSAGVEAGLDAGATHAHLTVRVANEAARRLYRSLGFEEQTVLVPARKGFTLP